MTSTYTCILLAGDRPGDPLAEIAPGKRKALLPLRGRPMVLYVLETLAASSGEPIELDEEELPPALAVASDGPGETVPAPVATDPSPNPAA